MQIIYTNSDLTLHRIHKAVLRMLVPVEWRSLHFSKMLKVSHCFLPTRENWTGVFRSRGKSGFVKLLKY